MPKAEIEFAFNLEDRVMLKIGTFDSSINAASMQGLVAGRRADECHGAGWQKHYLVRFFERSGGFHRTDWFPEPELVKA